ncbi:hypothetical protein [Streptacidiphilus sp. EB103A]|uniref:hypothetical protein n=1 Tax=Streptacidiphilus sp. EB103A TaxID=3156275 RepID=UPI003513B5C8
MTTPQYGQPAPAAPAKKSKAKGCAGIGCLGVVAIVAVIGIASAMSGGKNTPTASSSPAAGAATHAAAAPATTAAAAPAAADTITYVVTGSSSADVQYGPAGSSSQGHVPMSITKKLGTPQYASISVQLQGGGAASCQIEVNGKVVSKATANGGYNIAQCEISQDPINGGWIDTNGG